MFLLGEGSLTLHLLSFSTVASQGNVLPWLEFKAPMPLPLQFQPP